MGTVFEAFEKTALAVAGAPFLCIEPITAGHYDITPDTLAYGAVLERVRALSRRYREAGYGQGHRIGLLVENRPAFFLHWFALNALGAGVVPINSDMREAELAYLIGHSGICLAVTLTDRADRLARAAREAGCALALMSADDGAGIPAALTTPPRADNAPDSTTECALLYTSGTTGRPKGCVLSNDYFVGAGRWYAGIGGLCALRPGVERMATPLPLTHMNAMAYSVMAMVQTGGCLIVLDRFHPDTWWTSVRASGATVIHYLGVMPAMLLGAPASGEDRRHAVRFGFGAGVDRRQHALFEERFGFPLIEGWAMTETGAGAVVVANREPRQVGEACFGRAQPAVEWRLVNEAGADVPPGSPGELLVRAGGDNSRAGFFTEYLKDAVATQDAWEGGWFHTGDLVRADGDGNLYFVDRRKNVIRRSGENISALEVESVLAEHPLVAAVAVAAVPDAIRGDEVLACVVPRAPVDSTDRPAHAAELVNYALTRLSYFKVPGHVAFVDALPLTLSQKIARGELKNLAIELPGQPHCIDTRALKKRGAGE